MNRVRELLRFASVGTIATLTHALAYLLFLAITIPQLANLMGFILALLLSYFGHSRFTFSRDQVGGANDSRRIFSFFLVAMLGLALNAVFVHLLTSVLSLPDWSPVVFIAGVTPALTYCLLKYWVFRQRA